MKIIDLSHADREAERIRRSAVLDEQVVALEQSLIQMLELHTLEPDDTRSCMSIFSREDKQCHIEALEEALKKATSRRLLLSPPPPPPTFTCFARLPPELRLKIWDYAIEEDCRERVHSIDISRANLISAQNQSLMPPVGETLKFVSHLSIHPVLHVNRESRKNYISRTGAEFAFGTYINFETDIIFIPDRAYIETTFPNFFLDESIIHIQRLAMPNTLFCNLPSEPGEPMGLQNYAMRMVMPSWRETLIVFDDRGFFTKSWTPKVNGFVEMSAKQKRLNCARGYARQYCKVLNEMLDDTGFEPMEYKFGFLEIDSAAEHVDLLQSTFVL